MCPQIALASSKNLLCYNICRFANRTKKQRRYPKWIKTGGLFNDASHIIYVNGASHNDEDPVGRLMHDFRSTRAANMFYSELARQVRYFKETEGGQQKMCKAIEDMRKKERADAMFNNVKALMESMKWTAQQAMNAMKISEDDRQLLLKRF